MGILLVFAMSMILVSDQDSVAQDKKEKERIVVRSKAKKADGANVEKEITVEVKDGKIFVNGDEVAKNELAKLKEDGVFWVDEDHSEGMFKVRSRMDGERLVELRSKMAPMMERAHALASRGDAFAFFGDADATFFNGETMKMDMASKELAMKIRTAEGDSSELEAELDAMLNDIFNEKQDAFLEQVDALREKLAQLEQKVEERESNKADILDRRRKELLGKSSKWDW